MVSPIVSLSGVPIYGGRLDLAVEEAGNYWKSGCEKIPGFIQGAVVVKTTRVINAVGRAMQEEMPLDELGVLIEGKEKRFPSRKQLPALPSPADLRFYFPSLIC